MTRDQEKALISAVLELQSRVTHCEAMLESAARQEFERIELLRQLRTSSDHVLRLLRQKECLMEMVGRFVLEHQERVETIVSQHPDAQMMADIARFTREMQ